MEQLLTSSVDITYSCTLRCLHCYNSSGIREFHKKELYDNIWQEVITSIAEMKPVVFCFCGGEPLLRKSLVIKCAEIIHKVSPETIVNIVTNGEMLDLETAMALKKAGISLVQISFDGADSINHDWIRNRKGAFDFALQAMHNVKQAGLLLGTATIPNRRNYNELKDILDLCSNVGVNEFRMQPLMPLGRASVNLMDEMLDYNEYRNIVYMLERANYPDMEIIWGDPLAHLIAGIQPDFVAQHLSINAYGDIQISPYIPIIVGNVKKNPVAEYWNAGLQKIWKTSLVKFMVSQITSVDNMNLSKLYNIPQIESENVYEFDLLTDNLEYISQKYLENIKSKGNYTSFDFQRNVGKVWE